MAREIKTLSPTALEFMAWELTPIDERDPATQTQWCEAHGVPDTNPSRWKRSPAWKRTLDEKQAANLTDEGAIAKVMAVLQDAAVGGDVTAAKAFIQYAAALVEPDDENVRGMTDEELADALEAAALEVRARAA